jgi:serine O-acetyltransferase
VPPNSVVIGVPGQVVERSLKHHAGDALDLNHSALPDIIGVTLKQLLERVDSLEDHLAGESESMRKDQGEVTIHAPHGVSWDGQDFSI